MSQSEIEVQSRIAKIQGELENTVKSLQETLAKMNSENPPDNIRLLINTASATTQDAEVKVGQLGKANTAVPWVIHALCR